MTGGANIVVIGFRLVECALCSVHLAYQGVYSVDFVYCSLVGILHISDNFNFFDLVSWHKSRAKYIPL